jgi:hypothetical protein
MLLLGCRNTLMDIGCENKGKSNQKQLKRAKTYWKTIQISLYGNEFMMKKSWNSVFVAAAALQAPLCKFCIDGQYGLWRAKSGNNAVYVFSCTIIIIEHGWIAHAVMAQRQSEIG